MGDSKQELLWPAMAQTMDIMKRTRSNQAGRSLLEMVAVAAITMILAGMMIPRFTFYLQASKTAADAEDIGQQLALAKMRAAAYGRQYQVYFGTLSGTNIVNDATVCTPITGSAGCYQTRYCTAPVANTVCTAFTNEGSAISLHPGVSYSYGTVPSTSPAGGSSLGQGGQASVTQPVSILNGSSVTTSAITFNSRGTPIDASSIPTAADVLYLADNQGGQYAVSVNSSGRVMVQQYQGSAWKCVGTSCQ